MIQAHVADGLVLVQLRSFPIGLTENAIHREEEGDRESSDSDSDSDSSISNRHSYETATIPPVPIGKACDREYFQNLIRNTSTQPHPVRKIIFRIVSHDQGWTTDDQSPGPFIVAKTWFDAGIERFDASHSCKCQQNIERKQGPRPSQLNIARNR